METLFIIKDSLFIFTHFLTFFIFIGLDSTV